MGFPGGSAGKESSYSAGDLGLVPGLGRSPGEGKGYPRQYSGLENSHGFHGVLKSRTHLSNFHFTSHGYLIYICKFHIKIRDHLISSPMFLGSTNSLWGTRGLCTHDSKTLGHQVTKMDMIYALKHEVMGWWPRVLLQSANCLHRRLCCPWCWLLHIRQWLLHVCAQGRQGCGTWSSLGPASCSSCCPWFCFCFSAQHNAIFKQTLFFLNNFNRCIEQEVYSSSPYMYPQYQLWLISWINVLHLL